jgi:hypothetical protein
VGHWRGRPLTYSSVYRGVLRLRRRTTADLVANFGPGYHKAVIHRDSLVVIG